MAKRDDREVWRQVDGYGGRYYVSSSGRVFSSGINGGRRGLLKDANNRGYRCVVFCCNGVTSSHLVHRLVAEAFIPNPDNKPQVNHKNGDKTDNRVENLEWVTYSENNLHSYRVLGNKGRVGVKSDRRKLDDDSVRSILSDERPASSIARDYGVCQQTIYNIKGRKYYREVI